LTDSTSSSEHHNLNPQDHLINEGDFKVSIQAINNNNNDKNTIKSCRQKLKEIMKQIGKKTPNEKLMITPCNHIFHPECLKLWGQHKNECPICRKRLPLIEED
jgi:hypothetical protein